MRDKLRRFVGKYGGLLMFLTTVAYFSIRAPLFMSPSNWTNIVKHSTSTLLVSLGLTFSLLSGGLDMSIGATYGFGGMVCAILLSSLNVPWPLAIGGALLAGCCVGALNSILTLRFRIPAFVATLGTMFILSGLQLGVTGARRVPILNSPAFVSLGQGQVGPVPYSGILAVVVCVIAYLFSEYTRAGAHVSASGENPEAARRSGVPILRIQTAGFVISGCLCALAGVVSASSLSGASPLGPGVSFVLSAVVAVFLGGIILGKGRFTVLGTIIGALFVGMLTNGLAFLQISHLVIQGVTGFLLIAIVAVYELPKRQLGQMLV